MQSTLTVVKYSVLRTISNKYQQAEADSAAKNPNVRTEHRFTLAGIQMSVKLPAPKWSEVVTELSTAGLVRIEGPYIYITAEGKHELVQAEASPNAVVMKEFVSRVAHDFTLHTEPVDLAKIATSMSLSMTASESLAMASQNLDLITVRKTIRQIGMTPRTEYVEVYLQPKGKALVTPKRRGVLNLGTIEWRWKEGLEKAISEKWVAVVIGGLGFIAGHYLRSPEARSHAITSQTPSASQPASIRARSDVRFLPNGSLSK